MSDKIQSSNPDLLNKVKTALNQDGAKVEDLNAKTNFGVFKGGKKINGDVRGSIIALANSRLNGASTAGNKPPETQINPDGSGVKVITKIDKSGNVIQEIQTLGAGGKVLNKKATKKNKDGKLIASQDISYKYDKNGKLKSNKSIIRTADKTTVSDNIYNSDGKLAHQDISTATRKGKKVLKTKARVDYEYADGKLTSKLTTGKDTNGKPFATKDNFESDGKTLKNRTLSYYKRGALYKDYYEGDNLKNRTQGGIPSGRIKYDSDGKTVKETIKNEFDENGVFIGRKKYDENGKLVEQKDFSKVDGKFDTAYQIGRGDCYLLASINSLSQSEEGQKLLQQNVTESVNDKGEKVYTISFPGAEKARESLINGGGEVNIGKFPEDKVHIQGSYTVTEAELEAAAKRAGKDYSAGDKDVLMLEVAYEKYRNDVAKTIKDNNIDPGKTQYVAGLGIANVSADDNLSGGNTAEATYILTGKQSDLWMNSNRKTPTCYVDSDMNMHVADSSGNLSEENQKAMAVMVNNDTHVSVDDMLDKLREDSRDGKLDNHSACASFKVSSQEVNGQVIAGGGHALTVVKVTDDEVVLSNPWDPDTNITMSIEDFKKAATKLSCIELEQTNNSGQSGNSQPNRPSSLPDIPLPNSGNSSSEPALTPTQLANLISTIQNQNNQQTPSKPNYTVPQGQSYTAMIRQALTEQGIKPTKENIQKAKAQFEKMNPDAVHTYNGKRQDWKDNRYLMANDNVFIPKFKM